jgi:iron(III) transport system substrate-binding protein
MRIIFALISLLSAAFACPALAQTGGGTLAALAGDASPERAQKLLEGAKREGSVTLYTSAAVEDMAVLGTAFEKKYGVKVRVWRGSSENIVQRSVAEARGNRFDADVFETGALAMESLHREKLLAAVSTDALASLIPAAVRPHREWIGTRFNIFVASHNTRLVPKEELPARYEDLLDRRWKGRLGVEAEDSDWFGTLVGAMGEERGLALFRDIVAANGISVRKGHTLMASLVISGEVPFALTTYAYKAEQLKRGGAPLDWLIIPPAVARFEGAGVSARAPHPHAAILWFEFMLTDAQDLLLARQYFPARANARALPEGVSLVFIDPAKGLDENQKWSKTYREVLATPPR